MNTSFFIFLKQNKRRIFYLSLLKNSTDFSARSYKRSGVESKYPELSDRKLAFIGIMLALAMERVATGFSVEEESYPSQINKDLLKVAKQIFCSSC